MSRNDFRTLLSRACNLQVEINKEQRRPQPDWQRLSLLKKHRLAVKDRIAKGSPDKIAHMHENAAALRNTLN